METTKMDYIGFRYASTFGYLYPLGSRELLRQVGASTMNEVNSFSFPSN